MAVIKFTNFAGLSPVTAPELLPDNAAQIAVNCRLIGGAIEPLRAGAVVFTSGRSGTIKSIFRIKDSDGETWLSWNNEVDCVRGPIPGVGRYYYTGDGEPRVTTYGLAVAGGGNAYPAQARVLGLPKPQSAPSVSVSGGTGATVSRYYCYTFFDDWGQESAPSPLSTLVTGNVDGTWAISGMDVTPPNSGGITNITYTGLQVTITSSVKHFNRAGEYITVSGVTTVSNVNGTWRLTAVNTSAQTMTFVVSAAPSGTYNNAVDTTDTWTRVASFGPCTKRLYRSEGSNAQFQLVVDGLSGTTYNDTLSASQIPGDELLSASWEMPPVNLKGLRLHPSGALVGISDNKIVFSEPFQPHAWPPEYGLQMDYPGVGLAVFGTTIAVGTTATPYLIQGTQPGQMALSKFDAAYPCLSSRGMVSTTTAAVYPSTHGLVQISDGGVDIITRNVYSPVQWATLVPSLMFGAYEGGILYFMAQPYTPSAKLLIFSESHVESDLPCTALYVDGQTGFLYYVLDDNKIYAFDQSTSGFLTYNWKSKEVVLPAPETFTAAEVLFDTAIPAEQLAALRAQYDAILASNQAKISSGNVRGALNARQVNKNTVNGSEIVLLFDLTNAGSSVSFSLYTDGQLRYSFTTASDRPFRLPSGYKAQRIAVRVSATTKVKLIELATNPTELQYA